MNKTLKIPDSKLKEKDLALYATQLEHYVLNLQKSHIELLNKCIRYEKELAEWYALINSVAENKGISRKEILDRATEIMKTY